MNKENIDILKNGLDEFNIKYDDNSINKLLMFKDLLIEWNEKINLTAITDEREIFIKHFLDSLSINKYIEGKKKFVDIGTGAGFPGIPLAILNPTIKFTLIDSLNKRVNYLNEVKNKLQLNNIDCLHSRAEDGARNINLRETFDCASARAVAKLSILIEYAIPYLKVNGVFIAMKGSNIEELNESESSLKELGSKIIEIKEFKLPLEDIKRNIIIVKKVRQTHSKYPRKSGVPTKKPL